MMSPYGIAEKQALLEAPDLKTRAEILVAATEIELAKKSSGGETPLQSHPGGPRRPEPCNHHIKLLSDRRADIDGLFHRPFTGRVYEFHILVFDPSHPASHSLTAQTTRGVQFPARRGGSPTRPAYERFRIDLLS